MTDFLTNIAPEIFYALCGLVCLDAGWRAFRKNDKAKYGTALFWVLVGVIFILGKWIPSTITGGILVVMGILTVSGQVRIECRTKRQYSDRSHYLLPWHGNIHDDYGKCICGILCHYSGNRYSLCHCTGRKPGCCRSTWYDLRILWYLINTHGCHDQHCANGCFGNKK